MRILIIGSSGSALSCAEALRQKSDAEITIIGKENEKPYFRPSLSHMILNENEKTRFYLKPETYYEENKINLILGKEATKIDTKNKQVQLDDGEAQTYDKLVIATGSNNFVPPVAGVEKQGVFNLKYHKDLKKINEYAKEKKQITIVGAGLLGIEAAWSFKKTGKEVTIVEFAPRAMINQLSEKASQMIKEELEKSGIKLLTSKSVKEIQGPQQVENILLESGENIKTEVLLYSIGVRPNVQLAKEAGLSVDRGILVDHHMQTSEKDIYAIGDCCQIGAMVPGTWPLALQTGKIAAENILGTKTEISINPPMVLLKALEIGVYSAGNVSKAKDYVEHQEGKNYKFFAFEDNRLVGINLVGDTKLSAKAPRLLSSQTTKSEIIALLKGN